MLSIKTKLTLNSEAGIYFLNLLISLKSVGNVFLIISVMENVKIKLNKAAFWNMRELPFRYIVCQLIVSKNRCF